MYLKSWQEMLHDLPAKLPADILTRKVLESVMEEQRSLVEAHQEKRFIQERSRQDILLTDLANNLR
jgi:hypothetical protein